MRLRLLALAAAAATCAIALPSQAAPAPKPQITDPAGDSVIPQDDLDILSALFTTSGTTAKVGKKTVYTPKKLEITVTYMEPASTNPLATQVVTFNLAGCGEVYLQQYFGGTYGTADCVEGSFEPTIAAKGDTLQFTLPFTTVGKTMKAGAKLTALRTYVTGADPVVGLELTDVYDDFVADNADTSATYTIA